MKQIRANNTQKMLRRDLIKQNCTNTEFMKCTWNIVSKGIRKENDGAENDCSIDMKIKWRKWLLHGICLNWKMDNCKAYVRKLLLNFSFHIIQMWYTWWIFTQYTQAPWNWVRYLTWRMTSELLSNARLTADKNHRYVGRSVLTAPCLNQSDRSFTQQEGNQDRLHTVLKKSYAL